MSPSPSAASAATQRVVLWPSCRSQIEHGSNRSSLHLSQVIAMALREGPNGPATERPEGRYQELPQR